MLSIKMIETKMGLENYRFPALFFIEIRDNYE